LYDFGGCNDLYVSGGYTNGLLFGVTSSKAFITNVRIGAAAGTINIYGNTHRIVNCVFASPVVVNGTGNNIIAEAPSYDFTDNGAGNSIQIQPSIFTPSWTQSGGVQPSIGNGTLQINWNRDGFSVNINFRLTIGSTTVLGNSTFSWLFSLPVTHTSNATMYYPAQVVVSSSPNTYYQCTVQIASGTNYMIVGDIAQGFRKDYPVVWATGDSIYFSATYLAK
jgi:hypothetical protein